MIWQSRGGSGTDSVAYPDFRPCQLFAFVSSFLCFSHHHLDLIRRVSRHSAVEILMGLACKPRVRRQSGDCLFSTGVACRVILGEPAVMGSGVLKFPRKSHGSRHTMTTTFHQHQRTDGIFKVAERQHEVVCLQLASVWLADHLSMG